MSVVLAADRAAQPLIMNPSEDAPDEDAGEEIQPHMPSVEVAAIAAATAITGVTGAPTFDEEGPVWPDAVAESEIRAEVTERGETLNSKAARELAEAAAEAAAEKKGLPTLDALVKQIPADVRDTLEDLFRVKFVKVARVPKKALKE
ncbi:MAG: hypothetical protein WC661_20810 [Opitutaceae bacterium]